jgi:ubiquinone/menaquinone biosynthesis C-methylase UbiE
MAGEHVVRAEPAFCREAGADEKPVNDAKTKPKIEQWHSSVCCCDPVWEAAYKRFETPEEEIHKMRDRLVNAGAQNWPKDSDIVELFCGRGNGLKALASLGFTNVRGVDLSQDLLETYDGEARLFVGDCRELKLADRTVDVVIIQGGLHHLPELPGDLDRTFREIRRVLKAEGRFMMVEPWLTPFLQFVHAMGRISFFRKLWPKLDALATMIEREQKTYDNWLGRPQEILGLLHANFEPERESIAWGKIAFVGQPKANSR